VVWEDALGAATIAKQGMLVVVGYRFDGNVDVLVRAYDAATGELIWDDRLIAVAITRTAPSLWPSLAGASL